MPIRNQPKRHNKMLERIRRDDRRFIAAVGTSWGWAPCQKIEIVLFPIIEKQTIMHNTHGTHSVNCWVGFAIAFTRSLGFVFLLTSDGSLCRAAHSSQLQFADIFVSFLPCDKCFNIRRKEGKEKKTRAHTHTHIFDAWKSCWKQL